MRWQSARDVVEELRQDTRLYLPALTKRRGFSSCRVEHLLNGLVRLMPTDEMYFEVGVMEGRTLEAAATDNPTKLCVGCDPCEKYDFVPGNFPPNVVFEQVGWQFSSVQSGIGVAFYDGNHSADATAQFLHMIQKALADEAVIVVDDWDRKSVRQGASEVLEEGEMVLLAEMPEYTDGLTTAPHHFGYQFGVAVLGWRR